MKRTVGMLLIITNLSYAMYKIDDVISHIVIWQHGFVVDINAEAIAEYRQQISVQKRNVTYMDIFGFRNAQKQLKSDQEGVQAALLEDLIAFAKPLVSKDCIFFGEFFWKTKFEKL